VSPQWGGPPLCLVGGRGEILPTGEMCSPVTKHLWGEVFLKACCFPRPLYEGVGVLSAGPVAVIVPSTPRAPNTPKGPKQGPFWLEVGPGTTPGNILDKSGREAQLATCVPRKGPRARE